MCRLDIISVPYLCDLCSLFFFNPNDSVLHSVLRKTAIQKSIHELAAWFHITHVESELARIPGTWPDPECMCLL
jgi:hypothetical protein